MKSFKKFADDLSRTPVGKSVHGVVKKINDTAIKHERKTRIPLKVKHPFRNSSSTEIRKKTEKAANNFGKGAVATYMVPISQAAAIAGGVAHPALAGPAFAAGHAIHYGATGIMAAKAARRKIAAEKMKNRIHGGSISSKHPNKKRKSNMYENLTID